MAEERHIRSMNELSDLIADDVRLLAEHNPDPFLKEQFEAIQRDHAEYFRDRKGPNGQRWPSKKDGTPATLDETGELKRSLTTFDNYYAIREVTDGQLTFGTRHPASEPQQFGTRYQPARPHVGFSPKRLESLQEDIADEYLKPLE